MERKGEREGERERGRERERERWREREAQENRDDKYERKNKNVRLRKREKTFNEEERNGRGDVERENTRVERWREEEGGMEGGRGGDRSAIYSPISSGKKFLHTKRPDLQEINTWLVWSLHVDPISTN
ncbi:unnamed protein product [Pleuronectes platessa]|uniref:Uncharacterized protein n=1 Tax=Pleuronectes platessa TaxID=8262 RepID=A0A9N7U9T1_PLEPL|nr:unnamed protein product [Pleuronectes platessa]